MLEVKLELFEQHLIEKNEHVEHELYLQLFP